MAKIEPVRCWKAMPVRVKSEVEEALGEGKQQMVEVR